MCPLSCVSTSPGGTTPTNQCLPFRAPTACISPQFNLVHVVPPANAVLPPPHVYKLPSFLPPTSYLLPLHPHPPCVSNFSPKPPASSPDSSEFFSGMMEVFEPEALKYYTSFRFILWILSVCRNPTLTHLPLSTSLDTLLCDLIALTHSLAFFLPMT